ncbi:GntR family transcriptional regulator [Eubacterium pyruvativorans]|uniref:GntR family transcriptional regulator n=1 Tax=Eubacterium pyruvativorans TaxID=155865 RepID=UPI003F8929C8
MAWEFKDGIPIYRQLVRRLEISIAAGEYQSGEKMPSVRDLAMEAGVNPNTMQRALAELEAGGLLHSERTAGRFITWDEDILTKLRRDLAAGYVEDLFRNLGRLGMSTAEIFDTVRRWAEQTEAKAEALASSAEAGRRPEVEPADAERSGK